MKTLSDAVAMLPQRKDHAPLRGFRVLWALVRDCPEADALGHLGTLPGVAGCGHGIVGLEPELLAVGFRRELVRGVEMAPKDFLLLAADQTGEVVVLDRAAHRDGGLRLGRLGLLSTEGAERG